MRRAPHPAAAGMCLLLAAPAAADTFSVAAVGDSITHGDSEENKSWCDGTPANCGYPHRLAGENASYNASADGSGRHYDCAVNDCEFVNYGISGQKVMNGTASKPSMLVHIDDVLDDQGWDVVIVKGGTNDINTLDDDDDVSRATLVATLKTIGDKIIDAGADPVHVSILRFHPGRRENPAGEDLSVEDQNVDDFRDDLQLMASQEGRYFADAWLRLCPDSSGDEYHGHSKSQCFDDHYRGAWLPPNGTDPVGHPNFEGYDVLARAIYEELNKTPIPGAPSPTAPSGDVPCGGPADFTWQRESPQRATWYQVEIDGEPEAWQAVGDVCSGSSCALPAPDTFGAGSHTWRVRGRNPRGRGSWGSASFDVTAPPAPSLDAPHGDTGPSDPTYAWDASAGASGYRLVVTGPGGTLVDESLDLSSCDGGTCSLTPAAGPSEGSHSWYVQASNACGTATSSTLDFTFWPPATPELKSPKIETFETSPTFLWTDSGAPDYTLWIDDGAAASNFETDDSVCSDGTCSLVAGPLALGAYTWWVEATTPVEESAPSADEPLEVVPCGNANEQVQSLSYSSADAVRACATIEIGDLGGGPVTVEAGGDLLLHAGTSVTFENGFSVKIGGLLTVLLEP